jgi:hypothetical protein
MMEEINLNLTMEEVTFIAAVLNNLPTQSNAWPLVQKIKAQAEPQTPKEPTQ